MTTCKTHYLPAVVCLLFTAAVCSTDALAQCPGDQVVGMCEGTGTYSGFAGVIGTLAVTSNGRVFFRTNVFGLASLVWQEESLVPIQGVVALNAGRGQDRSSGTRVFASDGRVYFRRSGMNTPWQFDSTVPGGGVAAVSYGRSSVDGTLGDLVACSDGHHFYFRRDQLGSQWREDGGIPLGVTGAASTSWGSLKTKYR